MDSNISPIVYEPYMDDCINKADFILREIAAGATILVEDEGRDANGDATFVFLIGALAGEEQWVFFDEGLQRSIRIQAVRQALRVPPDRFEDYPIWMAVADKLVQKFVQSNPHLPLPAWFVDESR